MARYYTTLLPLYSISRMVVSVLLMTLCVIIIKNLKEIDTDPRAPEIANDPAINAIDHEDNNGERIIHFIESSGERCLIPRQACSIESAAISNPDFEIHLHMAIEPPPGKREPYHGEGLDRNCKTMESIKSFPNVRIIREDLSTYLKGTPLENVLPDLNQSVFADQHLTDAVRVALLYKLGGIYSDVDTIIFRSLRGLRNTVGHVPFEGISLIENNFMIFDRGSGLLRHLMDVIRKEYKKTPDNRIVMGPISLTKAFQNYCFHSPLIISPSIFKYTCKNGFELNLFNQTAFFPIGYPGREKYYYVNFTQNDFGLLENSYAAHVYDSGHGVHVPTTSLFAYLAKKFCPSIYADHEKHVYVF